MTVFDALVGQRHTVAMLQRAVAGQGMTHAWLFTGPPGSGRSNAAIAFAAALQCKKGGCGECQSCRTAMAGSHPDISVNRTDTSVHKVEDMRDLVRRAALSPSLGRYQIMVIEDADRLAIGENHKTANALLKAIEEPNARTIWMLCCPTVEDVLPTIRSRCRSVVLSTPSAQEVAGFLETSVGVPDSLAAYAARASQGHIGRARALALDEKTRNRRNEVVQLPKGLTNLAACLNAAANLVDIAKDETASITEQANNKELEDLQTMLGSDTKARSSRTYKAGLTELAKEQKQREKRRNLDVVDRCLMDLLSVYRDVIAVQTGAEGTLVNEEIAGDIRELARRTTPESNLRRIAAVFNARQQMMDFNTPPLLALEALMVALKV
ncbi:MAG TPA: DNA polymerase III subunit delta' [Nocardioidaceae bacterium]|nr:DNA polymerase III subunit delta' [Nocardioidaceae bacterium]